MATLAKQNSFECEVEFQVTFDWPVNQQGNPITTMLVEVDEALVQTSRLMSPYEAHMAAFHFKLLRQELLKTESDGRPSADILMMAGSWLLSRIPVLTPLLLRLLLAPPTMVLIARAGDVAVNWVEARAAQYKT